MKKFEVAVKISDLVFSRIVIGGDALNASVIAEVLFTILTGHEPDWEGVHNNGNLALDINREYDDSLQELEIVQLQTSNGDLVTVSEMEMETPE